jgi:SHS2 domain-containing protein
VTAVGFTLLPHTADVVVSAWDSTVEGCLAETVHGLVSIVADVAGAEARRKLPFSCDPGPETDLVVELLDEVIFVVDTEDAIPVTVTVARREDGGVSGEFGVVDRMDVTVVGPAPKAVTRHGLRFERDGSLWRCEVVVDV